MSNSTQLVRGLLFHFDKKEEFYYFIKTSVTNDYGADIALSDEIPVVRDALETLLVAYCFSFFTRKLRDS
jgi:hypothetical protein